MSHGRTLRDCREHRGRQSHCRRRRNQAIGVGARAATRSVPSGPVSLVGDHVGDGRLSSPGGLGLAVTLLTVRHTCEKNGVGIRNMGGRIVWCRRMLVPAMLVSLALAPVSRASRRPTHSERRVILRAGPGNPYPAGWARRYVRVSTVNARWAAVYIVANRGHRSQVQPDVASMYRLKSGRWVVHEAGNGGGCGVQQRWHETCTSRAIRRVSGRELRRASAASPPTSLGRDRT